LIVLTNDVTSNDRVANITPVRKPTNGASSPAGSWMIRNTVSIHNTAKEKKKPLVPAQRISPMMRLLTVIGAANIPS
jgi:hypothetical protein